MSAKKEKIMRRRLIDPEIWTDPKILKLQPIERLLFIGLVTQADDDGRLRGESTTVKAKIFPIDESQTVDIITEQLTRLDTVELITYYQVKGERYIQLNQWEKHQILRSDRKKESIYPASMSTNGQPIAAKVKGSEVKGSEVKGSKVSLVFSFESLWSKYPRRLGRKAAERHFKATVKTEKAYKLIHQALNNYIKDVKVNGTKEMYIQHGSRWFNNWPDWVYYKSPEVKQYENYQDKKARIDKAQKDAKAKWEKLKKESDEVDTTEIKKSGEEIRKKLI